MKPAEEVARELSAECFTWRAPDWDQSDAELVRIIRADRAAVLRWAASRIDTLAEGLTLHIDVFNVVCAEADELRALADQLDRDDRAERVTEVDVRAEAKP